MKKGEIVEGIIERVEFPNKGILMTGEGRRIVVKNAIPGQKVSALVNKIRKGKCEAKLLEVLEASPFEMPKADCAHFGECGGCTYQTLPYEKQLEMKASQVKKLIDEAVDPKRGTYEFLGIKASPRRKEYRNKMEFSFGDEYRDGPLALGMHRRGSFYDVVSVPGCQIVDGDFRTILGVTLDFFKDTGASYFHKLRHTGYLRHLLVRKAVKTGEILVDLVTTAQLDFLSGMESEEQLLNRWRDALLAAEVEGSLAGILHTRNDSMADAVINEGTEILYGQDYFYEELMGLRFKISPFSFFQTNSLGAEVLYQTVREFVLESYGSGGQSEMRGATIYDLYSGTGTIAQMMASVCGHVVGVEIVGEAVEAARENAGQNGLDNCDFLEGDVLGVLDDIEEQPDYIILDPPRDGIHPKALEKIIRYGVPQMVYISCKPTSLARDLEALQAGGYAVGKVCCVDMFPGTYHVETCVLLSKLKSTSHIDVEISLDEMDLTKAESKATYEEIKEYVWKQTGLKVSSLYIAQVKKKCGIIERVNYNPPKSENSRQPKCPPEKEKAIREALEYFGMIGASVYDK